MKPDRVQEQPAPWGSNWASAEQDALRKWRRLSVAQRLDLVEEMQMLALELARQRLTHACSVVSVTGEDIRARTPAADEYLAWIEKVLRDSAK
jgi:hypothetical protein